MNIREANVNDAPAIAKVTVDTWRTAYRGIINDDYLNSLTYEEREKGWREFPFDNAFVYVAENKAHKIVGFAAAGPERTSDLPYEGELYAIYIDQAFQNQGIGSKLFRSIVKRFEQAGTHSLLLWVLSDSPYRRFYERRGGLPVQSKMLEMEGFTNQITAYGWLDISSSGL